MEVSFLLDENIAAPLADKLDKAGHDVERVIEAFPDREAMETMTVFRKKQTKEETLPSFTATQD